MNADRSQTAELGRLVLDYFHQQGAIVEPPAYGIYEVLLPEAVARRLSISPFQHFAFDERVVRSLRGSAAPWEADEITLLYYGHFLVDQIVEEICQQTASARLYINAVRLDKRGLLELAEKSLSFPNAKPFAAPTASEGRALYHYVRFNFKASLISDEKRELVLPVWMYLQGGYPVDGEEIERLALLEAEPGFKNLPSANLVWQDGQAPFSRQILTGLLDRARQAALDQLADGPLESMSRRAKRFLSLDQARLEQYYDDLQKDLEKRLRSASEERRPGLEEKLKAVAFERQAKLADAREKYRLHVELELINLLIIAQPKIALPVEIKKRTMGVSRQVVWDPLLHRLEPLVCDVCGQPSATLWLCDGGHLAHEECLSPQCVECKRTFCQKCSEQVKTCVVCDRPVCVHSLHRCPTCGRGTCRDHMEQCHARDGEPARLSPKTSEPPAAVQPPAPKPAPPPEKEPPPPASGRKRRGRPPDAKSPAAKERTAAKPSRASQTKPSAPKGTQIEVFSEMARPVITAYVMAGKQEIATRMWQLEEDGIAIHCQCEKGRFCAYNGILIRPAEATEIESQLWKEIGALRTEYQVPAKRVNVYRIVRNEPQRERKLMLLGAWKDRKALAQAQVNFDELR